MDFTSKEFLNAIINAEGKSKVDILNAELKSGILGTEANHFSKIFGLTIEYEKEGKNFKKKFIIKSFPNSPLYDLGKSMGWYEREKNIYSKVLPEMSKLLKPDDIMMYPLSFKSIYDEALILEDLKADGYLTLDRMKQLDLPHSMVALKMIAKFHAASVKLNKIMDMEDVKHDQLFPVEGEESQTEPVFENGYEMAVKILEVEIPECFEKYKELKKDVWNTSKLIVNGNKNGFNVLNHGDFHCNNIMFKYDENGGIIDGKTFDFQVSRWCSPVTDIIYFFINSLRFEVFTTHSNELFGYYVKELNDALEKHECEERYELEDLKKEFDECWKYGLFVFAVFSPFLLAEAADPIDLDVVVNNDGNVEFDVLNKSFESRKYNQVLINWVSYYHQKGFL